MLFIPYEKQSGIQLLRSARGHLELRLESNTEARLYNWSASAVDAVFHELTIENKQRTAHQRVAVRAQQTEK